MPDADEKVALYTKAAELYTGKFANQAEAVKAYEAVLAIDPENRERDRLPPRDVREASRLGEAPRSRAARSRAPADGDERAREVPRDREARHRARQEARGLHRALAARCSTAIPTNAEALGALGGLYERAQGLRQARRASSRSRPRSPTTTPQKVQILTKLGTHLRRSPEQRRGRGRRRGARSSRSIRTIARRRRRSRRSTSRSVAGTTSRSSTPRAASGTSSSASSSSKRRRRPTPRPRSACSSRSPSSGRTRSRRTIARRAPTRRSSSSTPQNLARRRGAHPDLHAGGQRARRSRTRSRSSSVTKRTRTRSSRSSARSPASTRARSRSRRRRSSATSRRSSSSPRDEQTHRRRRARREGDRRAGTRSSRPTARRSTQADDAGDARARDHAAPAARSRARRRGAAASTRRSPVYRAVYDADSENADALAALERLYRADVALRRAPRHLREAARALDRSRREEADQLRDREALRDRAQGSRRARSTRTTASSRTSRPTRTRSRRSTSSTGSSSDWEPYVDILRRRIELDVGEDELIDLKFRLGQTLEKHLGDAAGALENYREILFLDAQHDGAREALEALLEQRGPARRGGRASSRTSTRSAATGRSSSRALDILARGRGRSRPARRAPAQDRARRERDARATYARAFEALAAALKERPVARRDARRARAARRASRTPGRQLDAISTTRSPRASPTRGSRASYWMRLAQHRRAARPGRRGGEGLRARPLARSGRRRGARRARDALLPRTERWTDLIGVIRASHRADAHEPERARGALRADGATSTTSSSVARTTRSPPTSEVLELDDASHVALAALDALFTRQRMWSELAENLEAQLALAADDEAADRAHAPPRGAARDAR